jgi:ribosomal protein S25
MKRLLASIICLFISISCFAQDLDSYKYVVVPYEFSFLNKHDQYRVNSLVRHLFKKEGFEVLYDTETFPKDLVDDRCLALYADISDDSGIFVTKSKIILRDCSNETVLESLEGRSRIKEYVKAYNETIRAAFVSVTAQKHAYKAVKKTKEVTPPKVEVAEKVIVEVKKEVPTPVKTTPVKTMTVTESPKVTTKTVTETTKSMLYAQPIDNGYQLVDSSPKVVMILLKTGVPNVYLVKGQDATVYKENGKWMLSKATSNGNEVSVLNVKF